MNKSTYLYLTASLSFHCESCGAVNELFKPDPNDDNEGNYPGPMLDSQFWVELPYKKVICDTCAAEFPVEDILFASYSVPEGLSRS